MYKDLLNKYAQPWEPPYSHVPVGHTNQYRPELEKWVENIHIPVVHKPGIPYYHNLFHFIQIPDITYFRTEDNYYLSLFHELGHAAKMVTGNWLIKDKEEAVAEYTAAKVAQAAGLKVDLAQIASYVFNSAPPFFYDHEELEAEADKRAEAILNARQPAEKGL